MAGWAAAAQGISDIGQTAADIYGIKWSAKFAQKMRNTAHQAEVKDLIRAGLNPILSATGGPGAQMPGYPPVPDVDLGDVGGGVNQLLSSAKQRELMDKQIEKASYDAKIARNDYDVSTNTMNTREKILEWQWREAMQRVKTSASQAGLMDTQNRNQRSTVPISDFIRKATTDFLGAPGLQNFVNEFMKDLRGADMTSGKEVQERNE